jgi:hypothetical protein
MIRNTFTLKQPLYCLHSTPNTYTIRYVFTSYQNLSDAVDRMCLFRIVKASKANLLFVRLLKKGREGKIAIMTIIIAVNFRHRRKQLTLTLRLPNQIATVIKVTLVAGKCLHTTVTQDNFLR